MLCGAIRWRKRGAPSCRKHRYMPLHLHSIYEPNSSAAEQTVKTVPLLFSALKHRAEATV
jgi:hypothetical protein